jgi:hypothetical protein
MIAALLRDPHIYRAVVRPTLYTLPSGYGESTICAADGRPADTYLRRPRLGRRADTQPDSVGDTSAVHWGYGG